MCKQGRDLLPLAKHSQGQLFCVVIARVLAQLQNQISSRANGMRFSSSVATKLIRERWWTLCIPTLSICLLLVSGCGMKLSPQVQITPNNVDFGNVAVNQATSKQVTITNPSSSNVTVSQATVSGQNFSLAGLPALPFSIAAGKSVNVQVTFKPDAAGTRAGTLSVASGTYNASVTDAALTGNGESSAAASSSPQLTGLSCTSSSVTGSGSDNCTVTVSTAPGTGGLNVSITSSNSAVTVPATVTVASGSLSAGFTAQVTGVTSSQSATLTAIASSVTKTFSINLQPAVSTASTSPQLSGLSCASSSITGSGSDNCTVTLSSAASSGGLSVTLASSGSSLTVPASVTVPSGATSATFVAQAASVPSTQSLTLTATAASVTKTYSLTLYSVSPTLLLSVTSLDFGAVADGSSSTKSLTLTSNGTAALTINSASISGSGFSVAGGSFPATLNPGNTVTLQIQFSPTSAASYTGSLNLSTNAPGSATVAIPLTGTGQSGTAATTLYEVQLSWSAPTSTTDPVTGYNIYREASGSSVYQLMNTTPQSSTSYIDTTVANGSTYAYYVESVDSSGNQSTPSNVYTATIP